MNIIYDCALDDMINLDKELIKIGSYFIKKNENSFDFKQFKFPLVDRFQIAEDVIVLEFEYQYEKARIIMLLIEVFEHICDPLEQKR
jgi:hypothetical protein